jgi:hypothetical protein
MHRGGIMNDTLQVHNLAELLREPYAGKLTRVNFKSTGQTVNVDLSGLTLNIFHNGRNVYYIDLEECITSAQLLDRIMQIAGKRWANPALLGLIVKVLNEALSPQAFLCSFGCDATIEQNKVKSIVSNNMRRVIAWQDNYQIEGIEISWR